MVAAKVHAELFGSALSKRPIMEAWEVLDQVLHRMGQPVYPSQRDPVVRYMPENISGLPSVVNMYAVISSLYLHSHHSCASSRFLFNPSLRSRIQVLEILSLITLLSSNLGTKSYVLRFLWNLHLSNSCLFSSGYTISPRFLSPRAHAKSRSHVHREPRHVPIPPVIPGGEYSLTPGTIPH